jgi:pyruvate/2-oxoglutarate dehydrogenase complex dihydrolipoamide acyltransferase (E2) component
MAKYADAFATRTAKLADHARKLIREDKYSEEEIARFDTSLGPILKEDFYQRPGTRATAAPAPAPAPASAPAPAATGMPSGFRVIR